MSWRITFLGSVCATREGKTITRFESSRVVALLARLALFPRRTHPREELVELLWPDVEREVALVRLRHTLRTLRQPLEAGLPAGSVLVADRLSIRINPEAVTTDVAEFERALARRELATAQALYAGELLPGLWDDWIVEERYRLEALAESMATPAPVAASSSPRPLAPAPFLPPLSSPLSVPSYLTAYFGREVERRIVREQLERSRLVTLTGLGGTGKTRLAVEVLKALAPERPACRAAFVALGECLVAAQIPGRLRDVLGLPATEADPLEQVCWALSEQPTLLVLDNLEQLVDSGGAELVEVLLARLSHLTVLATSRRALGVPGERLVALEPLSLEASQALFLDRVQATRPGFHLTAGNKDDIAAVCRGLEGIPLALELAAARIRAFSVSEMRGELQTRFEWLARTGLRGDKYDRHRSLAAALEWSWRLLPVTQQQFLAALTLFRAPWSASEAAAITGCSDARERLEALTADSLVASAASESDETRYTMLETVREFAQPRLEETPEARARFWSHYLQHPAPDRNTATAWEYALEDSAGEPAHAFAANRALDWTSHLGVGPLVALLERTLGLTTADRRQQLLATHRLAECLLRLNRRPEAMARMDQVVALLEDAPEELIAEALSYQAHIGLYDAPHEKTLGLLARCLELTRDPWTRAEALRLKGCLTCWTPGYEAAQALFDEAQSLYPPDDPGQRRLLLHRAHLARRRSQFDEALRLYQLGAERALVAGDNLLHKTCLSNLADILTCQGRWDDAIDQGLLCLKTEETYGDRHVLLVLVWNLARPLLEVGQAARAATLMSASSALWEREVRPLTPEEHEELAELRHDLTQALGEAELARLWSEGAQLTLKQALAEAHCARA